MLFFSFDLPLPTPQKVPSKHRHRISQVGKFPAVASHLATFPSEEGTKNAKRVQRTQQMGRSDQNDKQTTQFAD